MQSSSWFRVGSWIVLIFEEPVTGLVQDYPAIMAGAARSFSRSAEQKF
jgi:hypothetical protein